MAYVSASDPAVGGEVVTPHASTNSTKPFRALFVGGAGTVTVASVDGSVVLFTGVVAGTVLPIHGIRVNAIGTTATNITAMW